LDKAKWGIRTVDSMPDKGRTVMIYGQAGRGKTSLINTLHGNILLISIDCGEQVLDAKKDYNQIDLCTLVSRTITDPTKSVQKLECFIDSLMEMEELPWDYIIVDNISELQDVYASALRTKRNQDYSENFLNVDVSIDILRILKKMRNLTYKGPNVIYLAWEATVKVSDADGEIHSEKGPMIMGQSQQRIEGLVDFVMALRVDKKGSRYLQLDADHKYAAKKREEPGKEYPSIIECPKDSTDTLQGFFSLLGDANEMEKE
jgi:phage nucleotide-binding protein